MAPRSSPCSPREGGSSKADAISLGQHFVKVVRPRSKMGAKVMVVLLSAVVLSMLQYRSMLKCEVENGCARSHHLEDTGFLERAQKGDMFVVPDNLTNLWGSYRWGSRPVSAFPAASIQVLPRQKAPSHATSAICAIMLSPDRYIDEWAAYNFAIGFDALFIYDNSDNFTMRDWAEEASAALDDRNNNITAASPDQRPLHLIVHHLPRQTYTKDNQTRSKMMQHIAYEDCIDRYARPNNITWVAFFDDDEFLRLRRPKYKNVADFLWEYLPPPKNHEVDYTEQDYAKGRTKGMRNARQRNPKLNSTLTNANQTLALNPSTPLNDTNATNATLAINANNSLNATVTPRIFNKNVSGSLFLNWLVFGSSNHTNYKPLPVTHRFRYRNPDSTPLGKVIVYVPHFYSLMNAHSVHLTHGMQRDTNGKHVPGASNRDGPVNVAALHHYKYKSEEESKEKECHRGQVNAPFKNCGMDVPSGTTYDDSAWKTLKTQVKFYMKYEEDEVKAERNHSGIIDDEKAEVLQTNGEANNIQR